MACRALSVAIVTAVLLALPVFTAPAEVVFDGVAPGDPCASASFVFFRDGTFVPVPQQQA